MQNNRIDAHYHYADGVMFSVNIALFVFSLALATVYDTWIDALVIGGGTVAALAIVKKLASGSIVSRIANAMAFMVMCALHIHQTNGMIEMHFGIFVLLAVLLFYRDWVPIIAAAATTAVHHISFYYFQSVGMGVWILPDTDMSFMIIVLHAAYVVVEAALLVLMSISQKREYTQSSEIMSLIDNIAQGDVLDLSYRSSGNSELLRRFDNYTEEVARMAGHVVQAGETLTSGGQSLGQVTEFLKSSAKSQKDMTDEISVSMDAFHDSVIQVAEISSSAAEAANKADENAKEGARVNEKTTRDMSALSTQIMLATQTITELQERSLAIGGVLDVIKNIADQTNLLALNAAIEAARAGEQGRGFAVVADEVRTLAQRTQTSTQEIDTMIEGLRKGTEESVIAIESSKSHVESCVESVERGLELMSEVNSEIDAIAMNSRQIEGLTSNQLSNLEEINGRVQSISDSARNAVEKTVNAADSGRAIVGVSDQFGELTRRFKL